MKTLKIVGLVISIAIIVISISCNKEDENDNVIDLGSYVFVKAVFDDADNNPTDTSDTKGLEGATIEVYQSIKDWNNYELPIYSAVTDTSGNCKIYNDSLLANGLMDLTDCYFFAHKDSEKCSNWTNVSTMGKLYFNQGISTKLQVNLNNNSLYDALAVTKWQLYDVFANNIHIYDTTDCLKDNSFVIKRAYGYENINNQFFIFNEGVNICADKDDQDTLISNTLQGIGSGTALFYQNTEVTEEYGSYISASINGTNDTITFSGQFRDEYNQTYYVYSRYAAE